MTTPLFVFCADLHLEDGAWSTRPGIYGDAYYSFQQIVEYCIKQRLPLILGGDVLEKKSNSARPIAKLCDGLTRMQSVGLDVYYIQGNHEYDRNASWLSVHSWPVHMHKQSTMFAGVYVYGLDWLPRGEIQTALQEVPTKTHILVTHQVWKDFMGEVGRTECDLSDVHHVQTVLAGDFHVTKFVDGVNAQGQPVRMFSPGSTAMQDMGETPDKFFYVVQQRADGGIECQPVALKTRRVLNYVVKDVAMLDELCAGQFTKDIQAAKQADLPDEIVKPLVRVKFDKQLPDAYLRITTSIGEQAHLFCEAIAEKAQPKVATARTSAKNDLISAAADLLGSGSAYDLAAALLNAEDPSKEFDAQFSKYMGERDDATLEVGSEELGTPQVPSM